METGVAKRNRQLDLTQRFGAVSHFLGSRGRITGQNLDELLVAFPIHSRLIGILHEREACVKRADLCCKHGMSEGMFYAWMAKCFGITVSEAKRPKALENENGKVTRLLAE